MKSYEERQCDLFKEYGDRDDVYFAHYISADCVMNTGIAIQFTDWFKKKYNLSLRSFYSCGGMNEGTCIDTGRLFNLVTKKCYGDKLTYSSLERSLKCMAKIYMQNYVNGSMDGVEVKLTTIVMPCIDELNWTRIRDIIFKVFRYIPVNIIVCYL